MLRRTALCLLALCLASGAFGTALDDYVNAPDSNYGWTIMNTTYQWDFGVGYVLNMTSQKWLTAADSSRSIWWHYMVIIIPNEINFKDAAMLWITGGTNTSPVPTQDSEDLITSAQLANRTKTVVTSLFMIPNEPISFPSDPSKRNRMEDSIIAFTWAKFFNNTDQPEWLLRLPMTKACVAAMNATEEFLQQHNGQQVTRWVAAGASKRGWTTWTLGAVEAGKRLVAIIPIVMDALNLAENMHHMFRNLGGWTFAFNDYWDLGLTGSIDLPQMHEMQTIIDPYFYLDRLALLPKLVVDAGDDEFFQPDDNYLWWANMTGEKHLLMCQNAEHSLITAIPEVLQSVSAFVEGVLTNTARPEFNWTMDLEAGTITVVETGTVRAVKAFIHHAENLYDKRRDFRWIVAAETPTSKCKLPFISLPKREGLCLQPIIWAFHKLEPVSDGVYIAKRPIPTNGRWEAFFVTMHYISPLSGEEYLFTTQIAITPNKYPFPACVGEECQGTLV